jgi:putative ABC transport system substrate-binding protein
MMDRRAFLGALAGGLLAAPLAAEGQQAGKVYHIGVLEIVDEASNASNLSAFRQGLAKVGYVEGQNFVIEYRSADGRPERFPELAAELVRHNVDIIVTRGTPATLTAKLATRTIPIVMASSGDPVFDGTVASLARPGGNVTGLHAIAPPELGGKRLQLLKEAVPGALRIGILWNPDLYTPLIVRDTERVARAIGVQLKSLEVKRSEPFEQMFETALFGQIDALIAVEDQLTFTYRARFLEFAGMSRLPAIYGLREFVDAGGLMSYGTDRRDLYRRAATYVHRILAGASPATLPVEPPTKFELVINLKTAKALGLTIPPSLLQRTDQVIE